MKRAKGLRLDLRRISSQIELRRLSQWLDQTGMYILGQQSNPLCQIDDFLQQSSGIFGRIQTRLLQGSEQSLRQGDDVLLETVEYFRVAFGSLVFHSERRSIETKWGETNLHLLEQLDRSTNCSLWEIADGWDPVEEGFQQLESGDETIHGRLTRGL